MSEQRALSVYKTLNTIKPSYFQTNFPFNLGSSNKIVVDTKKMKIIAVKLKSKITGGKKASEIIFYE